MRSRYSALYSGRCIFPFIISAGLRESAVTDGNEQSYAGAVVVVEKGDDSSADAKAVIGGEITNTSGDAVIYVGYGRAARGSEYKAVTLNETASINGNVVELTEAYEQSSASDGIDMEIYAVSGGKMALFTNTTEAGAGDKFEYKNALNIDSSYTVTVDYDAEGIDDEKARYVLYTENIADQFNNRHAEHDYNCQNTQRFHHCRTGLIILV